MNPGINAITILCKSHVSRHLMEALLSYLLPVNLFDAQLRLFISETLCHFYVVMEHGVILLSFVDLDHVVFGHKLSINLLL